MALDRALGRLLLARHLLLARIVFFQTLHEILRTAAKLKATLTTQALELLSRERCVAGLLVLLAAAFAALALSGDVVVLVDREVKRDVDIEVGKIELLVLVLGVRVPELDNNV